MSKKFFSIVLAIMLVLAVALSATGCGSSGPKKVINTFFESIDKQDTKKFLNCFEKDVRDEIKDEMDEDDIEDLLKMIDKTFDKEYGKKWIKEIKVTDVEKGDTDDGVTEYEVTVEFDDEEEEFDVIKVKGKYYIDDSAISGFGIMR